MEIWRQLPDYNSFHIIFMISKKQIERIISRHNQNVSTWNYPHYTQRVTTFDLFMYENVYSSKDGWKEQLTFNIAGKYVFTVFCLDAINSVLSLVKEQTQYVGIVLKTGKVFIIGISALTM